MKRRAVRYLPEEIIRNILRRLPVKSLIRFQCVCKHWKNLIKSPSFIADHLHHSNHQNPLLLFDYRDHNRAMNLRLLECEMKFHGVQNEASVDSHTTWIIATREARQIVIDYLKCYRYTRFGFSPILNDYKIVIIFPHIWDDPALVYSVSSSSWKKVDCLFLEHLNLSYESFCVNGVIFWIGKIDGEDHYTMLSFDMAMELFTLTPLPPIISHPERRIRLTVYEKKLAVLSLFVSENQNSFVIDLWLMEEGIVTTAERWNWMKKCTSNPLTTSLAPRVCPMAIWRNEIICIAIGGDETKNFLINITTNEFNRVRCHFSNFHLRRVFNYVESLGGTMFV
ncbi:putative F-box protein At5g62060 [Prosopis cineraria]|uniref:putative F-box protein At5g62060 n=1 Tax=Prosopis cineraria TaxID=364024 RepID=UPI00241064D3|nr:putative F-box protein At5g62060 [Prosopis cineraria]